MKQVYKKICCAALMPLLAALAMPSFAAGSPANAHVISPTEKAQIESIIHEYLLAHPEVILQAMQVLQAKQFEQAKQAVQKTQQDAPKYAQALFHDPNSPVAGNPKGTLTLVEFFDYQCPHCVDVGPTIDALIKANPNLRVVYKEWPIRGPISNFATRAALAANQMGSYAAFHQALLAAPQPLTQDAILQIASKVGLNADQLQKTMAAPGVENSVKANITLAQNLKLFGTPAFFLGKTDGDGSDIVYMPGQLTQDQLQGAIDKMKS
jgi:protein-disulfide isomerase